MLGVDLEKLDAEQQKAPAKRRASSSYRGGILREDEEISRVQHVSAGTVKNSRCTEVPSAAWRRT